MTYGVSPQFASTLPAAYRPLVTAQRQNDLKAFGVSEAERLIKAAAALAERNNYEAIQVFQQKWSELKKVLAQPAEVTFEVLRELKDDAAEAVCGFCQWFRNWSAMQYLALGQP